MIKAIIWKGVRFLNSMRKIVLFDYQEDMVRECLEAFRHHQSVMVQMPTGTGNNGVGEDCLLVLGEE